MWLPVPVNRTGAYLETSTIIASGTPVAGTAGGTEAFWAAAFATQMAASSAASFSRRSQSELIHHLPVVLLHLTELLIVRHGLLKMIIHLLILFLSLIHI